MLRWLGIGSFYSYVGALLALGLFGALWPQLELRALYQTDLGAESGVLLHQYRFLKFIAVGAGIYGVVFRREIFESPRFGLVFLTFLFGGVAGRLLAIAAAGGAHPLLVTFAVSEAVFGACILLYARTTWAAQKDDC